MEAIELLPYSEERLLAEGVDSLHATIPSLGRVPGAMPRGDPVLVAFCALIAHGLVEFLTPARAAVHYHTPTRTGLVRRRFFTWSIFPRAAALATLSVEVWGSVVARVREDFLWEAQLLNDSDDSDPEDVSESLSPAGGTHR